MKKSPPDSTPTDGPTPVPLWARGLAALATGLLFAGAFPSYGFTSGVWVAAAPLLVATQGLRPVRSGLWWVFGGFVFYSVGLSWMYLLSGPGTIVLMGILCSYLFVFGAVTPILFRCGLPFSPVLVAAAWVILDLGRARILGGFPWLSVGHSLVRDLPWIQIADVTGTYGVTFLPLLAGSTIAAVWRDRRARGEWAIRTIGWTALVTVAILGLARGYGEIRLRTLELEEGPRLAAIQPGIDPYGKTGGLSRAQILDMHHRLSLRALSEEPDLVVWSETMAPPVSSARPESLAILRTLSREYGTSLLVGAEGFEPGGEDGKPLNFNRAVYVRRPDGGTDTYDKVHLVPFGEFLPFRNALPFREKIEELIRQQMGRVSDLEHGDRFPIFRLSVDGRDEPYGFGASICFDIVFSRILREFDLSEVDFIVNLSNDGWYFGTAEPQQIMDMAVFRAVEYRRAVFRATNLGISGAIAPTGEVEVLPAPDDLDRPDDDPSSARVLLCDQLTPYARFGDLFALICGVVSGIGWAVGFRRRGQVFLV